MSQPAIRVPSKITYVHDDGTKDVFICNEKLGQGGFAVVHRVTQQNTNKSYAMKVISIEKYINAKNKIYLDKVENEILIQKKLNHPNIVGAKISFSDEQNQYIILEYCPGKTIRDYLKKSEHGRLSEPETRRILKDILQGLVYLHNRKIIHHDIKLENFIIGADGKVKIADFGVSVMLRNSNDKILSLCGTPNYMSPEMVHKENKGHGLEVDIWAIGVSAFIMLTGQQPFSGYEKEFIFEKIKNCDYRFPTKIQLSYEAKDFIKSIFKADPKKRPDAIDLLDHPFLTKYDKEKVQLYKPPIIQTTNKSLPQIPNINSNKLNFLQKINNIAPLNNRQNLNCLRGLNNNVQIVRPKYVKEVASSLKKFDKNNNFNFYPQENCQPNNLNSNNKKSFIIPSNFVTKYCFLNEDLGFLLGNGTVGVCFNDHSRIVMDPNEEFAHYYKNYNSNEEVINVEESFIGVQNNKIQAKISLLRKFAKNLKRFKCLYKIEEDYYDSKVPLCHVKYFVKKNDSILFKMNFNDHKKLIIFWSTKKMCLVKILKEKCNLLDLKDVISMSPNCDEYKKYKYAKELLFSLSQKI